jgi:hypothetical protein
VKGDLPHGRRYSTRHSWMPPAHWPLRGSFNHPQCTSTGKMDGITAWTGCEFRPKGRQRTTSQWTILTDSAGNFNALFGHPAEEG